MKFLRLFADMPDISMRKHYPTEQWLLIFAKSNEGMLTKKIKCTK